MTFQKNIRIYFHLIFFSFLFNVDNNKKIANKLSVNCFLLILCSTTKLIHIPVYVAHVYSWQLSLSIILILYPVWYFNKKKYSSIVLWIHLTRNNNNNKIIIIIIIIIIINNSLQKVAKILVNVDRVHSVSTYISGWLLQFKSFLFDFGFSRKFWDVSSLISYSTTLT